MEDKFAFTDNTEMLFKLPERECKSFRRAAISRLNGGIHYRDAIENGQAQGKGYRRVYYERLKKADITPAL